MTAARTSFRPGIVVPFPPAWAAEILSPNVKVEPVSDRLHRCGVALTPLPPSQQANRFIIWRPGGGVGPPGPPQVRLVPCREAARHGSWGVSRRERLPAG